MELKMKLRCSIELSTWKLALIVCAALGLALTAHAAEKKPVPVWTDVNKAAQEVPHYALVGEYISRGEPGALQANLLPDGKFLVAIYQGGLPGPGWDKATIVSKVMAPNDLQQLLKGFKKTKRVSPSMGKPAPKDAILKFPRDFPTVKDGLLWSGTQTQKHLESFQLHLEFRVPLKPGANPSSQKRGNSGIYIFNNYEVQVLDSFALDLDQKNNAIPAESQNTQWCGALYKAKIPDLNMAFPPLTWQTYDILFNAPKFQGEKKIRNARITVLHNGVRIHDNVELETGTGAGAKRKQVAKGPIVFQGHGNPVVYRNVWAIALEGR
jgi:hypothetical protein